MVIFSLAFGGVATFQHQVKREVAPVDLNHIQPIIRLRLGPLTFFHFVIPTSQTIFHHPLQKGFTFVVDWGGVNRPYTNFKKHTPFVLDR